MENLLAGPAESRLWLVSLSYRIVLRSSASKAYKTAGPPVLNWSERTAQAMPSCVPSDETENVTPGYAEVKVVLLAGLVLSKPLLILKSMPALGVPPSSGSSPPAHRKTLPFQ